MTRTKSTNQILEQWLRLFKSTDQDNEHRLEWIKKTFVDYIHNIARHFGRSKDNPMTDEEQNTQLPREIYAGY